MVRLVLATLVLLVPTTPALAQAPRLTLPEASQAANGRLGSVTPWGGPTTR